MSHGVSLLDLSPDLVHIRPIRLTETDINQMAERWRSCCCCHELLDNQAIQMKCCDAIYHIHCLRSFAKQKAIDNATSESESAVDFSCPWCRTTLNCIPNHVWAYLEEPEVSTVLAAGEHLDKWLTCLSKLSKSARMDFMDLAEKYENTRGKPMGAMQLPVKANAVRKLCESQPAALEAFEMLCEGQSSSFEALLEWESWLLCEEDLETQADLLDAETMYGRGPNRFVARIVERLRSG